LKLRKEAKASVQKTIIGTPKKKTLNKYTTTEHQTMSSATSGAVQKDWETREVVEIVQLNVVQIVSFLNQFDNSVRSKLSLLHEKLTRLERSVELVEASIKTTLLPVGDETTR